MSPRRPQSWELPLLRLWHAALAGGFVVAWLSADEDTYRMHVFAGYWVITALLLRLVLAAVGSPGGPLALARPGRSRMMGWMAVALLLTLTLAGVSGAIADVLPALEDLHEAISESSLWVILGHVALVVWVFLGRRLWSRATALALLVPLAGGLAVAPAEAGEPAREAILAEYAKAARVADPSFAGFSAARGEALYRSRNTASADFASCATCHTDDPTRPGRHAKTGREIAPAAVSVTPKRFTDAEKVEERFTRDCKTVLGRACSAVDKGDYITFLMSK